MKRFSPGKRRHLLGLAQRTLLAVDMDDLIAGFRMELRKELRQSRELTTSWLVAAMGKVSA